MPKSPPACATRESAVGSVTLSTGSPSGPGAGSAVAWASGCALGCAGGGSARRAACAACSGGGPASLPHAVASNRLKATNLRTYFPLYNAASAARALDLARAQFYIREAPVGVSAAQQPT